VEVSRATDARFKIPLLRIALQAFAVFKIARIGAWMEQEWGRTGRRELSGSEVGNALLAVPNEAEK